MSLHAAAHGGRLPKKEEATMQTMLERQGFDPAQDADNGNRFLTGNGYIEKAPAVR